MSLGETPTGRIVNGIRLAVAVVGVVAALASTICFALVMFSQPSADYQARLRSPFASITELTFQRLADQSSHIGQFV